MQINKRPGCAALPSGARRESANAVIAAAVALAQREVQRLIAEGHAIDSVEINSGRPAIRIVASARLAALAEAGDGAYWSNGHDQAGRFRCGQLVQRACRVTWTERDRAGAPR